MYVYQNLKWNIINASKLINKIILCHLIEIYDTNLYLECFYSNGNLMYNLCLPHPYFRAITDCKIITISFHTNCLMLYTEIECNNMYNILCFILYVLLSECSYALWSHKTNKTSHKLQVAIGLPFPQYKIGFLVKRTNKIVLKKFKEIGGALWFILLLSSQIHKNYVRKELVW